MGRALCARLLERGDRVVAPGSREANLTQAGSLDRFDDVRYDWIVHLAAWTQAGIFACGIRGSSG